MRKKKSAQVFMGTVVLLFLVVVLVCVFFIVHLACSYLRSQKTNKNLTQIAIQTPEPTATLAQTDEEPTDLAEQTPAPVELPITVDWEELKSINSEIVAWLYCENTPINYPVVQHKDNEYYTTRNFQKEKDSTGALFFDYRNNVGWDGENMIIYGHRMRDDSLFGVLPEYTDVSFFDQHPDMYLLTPDRNFRIDIFACRTVRADIKYFPTSFSSVDAYNAYTEKAYNQSYWQTASCGNEDSVAVVTMVTCSNYSHSDNPRLQVLGWAIPLD